MVRALGHDAEDVRCVRIVRGVEPAAVPGVEQPVGKNDVRDLGRDLVAAVERREPMRVGRRVVEQGPAERRLRLEVEGVVAHLGFRGKFVQVLRARLVAPRVRARPVAGHAAGALDERGEARCAARAQDHGLDLGRDADPRRVRRRAGQQMARVVHGPGRDGPDGVRVVELRQRLERVLPERRARRAQRRRVAKMKKVDERLRRRGVQRVRRRRDGVQAARRRVVVVARDDVAEGVGVDAVVLPARRIVVADRRRRREAADDDVRVRQAEEGRQGAAVGPAEADDGTAL